MIKRNLTLALTLSMTYAFAQNIDLPTEYINNTTSGGVINNIPSDVLGSPYVNEEFVIGKVYVRDDAPYTGILRYNAYSDGIEMQTENGIITLLKRDYIKASFDGNLYLIENYKNKGAIRKTYFVEKNKGTARLLVKLGKKFVESRSAASSYSKDQPAKFEDEISYYIITEGNPAVETRLKAKDVINVLPDHKKELTAFVKENKLKLKTEEEVIQLLGYYNSL